MHSFISNCIIALCAISVLRCGAIPFEPLPEERSVRAARKIDSQLSFAGRSGVPAMHAALLQNGQVVFLDKIENITEMTLPNGYPALSSMYDPATEMVTALNVLSNAFCCAGTFLADGRLVTLGGSADLEWLNPTISNGYDAIRYLDASGLDVGWTEPGHKLASKRWYATSQVLGDGKIFVAAGSLNTRDPQNKSNNNPTYEVLDENGISNGINQSMDLLVDNQPY